MARRNDDAIAAALQVVAQVVQNQLNAGGNDEFRPLGKLQKNNPLTFKDMYDPDGEQTWLREIVLDVAAEVVIWDMFCREFLRKYFPKDVCRKNKIEFLEMNEATAEFSKCIKFENSLRPEIKQKIRYQHIRRFLELVNNCRIYGDDSKGQSAHYQGLSERRGKQNLNHGKPYSAPANKGK
ncbi:uncharacterized protein LOC127130495 [Lathyrus oleraceus]|uniref:uncharacterized protein LOC127130495 n=1 Tax=Pisum sativum TaxID=3888 RepID=UPI0021CF29B8|nr:uncharacterized protein LOC127130495 [Pisum sativum]